MFELTATALMFTSLMTTGMPYSAPSNQVIIDKPVISESVHKEPMTLEAYVRDYFKNTPELAEVAYCESTFRHFDKDGKVLRGEVLPEDIGVMQINETYHKVTAKRIGYDIYTLEGNLGYAKYLFENQGMKPWNSSKKCWKSATVALAKIK